jgi:UTP--glucose-1-phosphate uridylyltransferase
MVDDYAKHGCPMIGVQEVSPDDCCRYGIVKLKKGTMELDDIIEKPAAGEAPSNLADFGRMILNQEFIDILRKIPLGKDGELWTVDAIKEYVRRGGKFMAKKVENGEWLTTGDPLNYLKAVVKYAVDREDIGSDFKKFARKIIN